jgi:diaminopimelate epimerase
MNYTKMHGAGNSFLILESPRREEKGEDLSDLALRLCSEKTGPGADGLIVVLPGEPGVDFSMLFYNADGSLGEMCGNGARCVARYAVERGLSPDPEHIRFRATAGLITARRIDRERYEVRLPDPSVIDLRRQAEGEVCAYVELGDPGLPHAVLEVPEAAFDDPDALRERGRRLRHSTAFPQGAHVRFVCLLGETRVRAITFERGVEDFTLACGTGCGASAVSLAAAGRLAGNTLTIHMPGGTLFVAFRREGDRICDLLLTGPTCMVETGDFSL